MPNESMILLRTTWIDPVLLSYANELSSASAVAVSVLVDNRKNTPIKATSNIVPLNDNTYGELGLFLPADVGWRCGDYGLYAARRQFPSVKHFWLMEDNLRVDGDVRWFFSFFEEKREVDFLAGKYEVAHWDWYWWPYAQGRDVTPHRCQFGIVRVSATGVDVLYEKRRSQSRALTRRLVWPNDEAFVATTIASSNLNGADFNSFGYSFYEKLYSLEGEQSTRGFEGFPQIVHPVNLVRQVPSNAMASAHDRYTRTDAWFTRRKRAIARRINGVMPW